MEIHKLKRNEILEFSKLAKEIILTIPYYSKLAKAHEIKKYSPSEIRRKLNKRKDLFLVLEDKGTTVGFCAGYFDAGTYWVDWLGVDKKFRRRGLGEKLLKSLEKRLKEIKIHKMKQNYFKTS